MIIAETEALTGDSKFEKPVLVTGAPRSGTTWMGKMLVLSDQRHYIHEPFNPDYPIDNCISKIKLSRYMMYITEELDGYKNKYYTPFKKLIEGRCGPMEGLNGCRSFRDILSAHRRKKEYLKYSKQGVPPLIKDPIAIMSAGWLARTFDMRVIVMIRHPAAVVASMRRLNWTFEPRNWALSQPQLLRDYLSPFEAELKDVVASNADIIDRTAIMWKIIYFVVRKYQAQYPDWLYLRHEDIAKNPLPQFAELYRKLGLDFSDHVKGKIDEFTNASNPPHSKENSREIKLNSKKVVGYWKHLLSTDEIRRIRKKVEDVSRYFYRDEDWAIDTR